MTSIQQITVHLRSKKKKQKASDDAEANQRPSRGDEGRVGAVEVCWLCDAASASPFTLNDAAPLCLACFYRAYDAFLRPQLSVAARSPRGRFVERMLAKLELDPHVLRQSSSSPPIASSSAFHVDRATAGAGSVPNFVLAPSHSRKRFASAKSSSPASAMVGCWSCPRCTFYNPTTARWCDACGGEQPQQLVCERCKLPLLSDNNRASVCPVAKKKHAPWHCLTCTVINVVDCDMCFLCQGPRKWWCSRCGCENTTRTTTDGDKRYCRICGAENVCQAPCRADAGRPSYEADREAEQAREFCEARRRLESNLALLGAKRREQVGDGNCLFRAIAQQVFNSAQHHMLVRHMTVEYVERHRCDYAYLFDGAEEMREYCVSMRSSGTWGDEVMLHAAARWLGLHVHVITSDEQRWHLVFAPSSESDHPAVDFCTGASSASGAGSEIMKKTPSVVLVDSDGHDATMESFALLLPEDILREQQQQKPFSPTSSAPHIFLAYLYPTHYDDIEAPMMPFAVDPSTALLRALQRVSLEEQDWVRIEEIESAQPDESSWVKL
jgi:hypothetical protein